MATHVAPSNNFSIVDSVDKNVQNILNKIDEDQAFWVGDLNRPRESLSLWEENLPDIKPYYAIKCCDEPNLLQFLADRGIGFDCASKDEIQRMIKHGVDPSKIVFSHPLKSIAALRYAKEEGVERLVYDTEEELEKIMRYYPDAEVYLRVKPKFSNAKIQLSNKFGASPEDVPHLLKITKELGANFIGFSFHVGSLCDDISTFRTALEYVSDLKVKAEDLGLHVCFIDIGGGFLPPSAESNNTFETISLAIQDAIDDYFQNDDIEFIAEPGRFIGSDYMDLHLPVISVKEHVSDIDGSISQSIFVPDGMYGAFNSLSYDHAEPHFEMKLKKESKEDAVKENKVSTILWGQTCDSADCVYENMMWPKLHIGDLLTIHKFSAYTYSPSSFFNGFGHHEVFVINREEELDE
ncbi:Pyridoxal-dependent decarboxylase, pyridoxal binding domain containing protein [Tritrichomonas foetus]|uniref:ornithine decarboxylase n=1 Tax=Tritrichomonas foetus TaxID=1144522 RepID=A0A1J4KV94_9EUKA|nr:Pyridoxal-dependent decarboxylase, pyridoxal binding domain containing protein [Tritrichomonas foetus]|eukprot:OHT14816.1 Pyridoxal-dependent decarboxylase, pyridoxal binding domain containing protein [Tritrichomonas foetus]